MTKFISDPSEIDRTIVVTKCFGQGGAECKHEKAILMSVTSNGRSSYKALVHNGSIYDPTSIKFPRERQYQNVSKSCFDKFLLALTTGDYQDYEKAAREYRKSE
jgi:hypothetical protein